MAFDRWGRYTIVPPEGGKAVPHTRATTLARTLDDEFGLTKWRQRMVGVGVAKRPDLLAQIAACQPDETSRLDALCRDAVEAAGASSSANLGQALHSFAQRVDEGEDLSIVPDAWRPDVVAYRAAMEEAGFVVELVERVCVVPSLKIAGTFDRTVLERGKRRYILDLKTGRTLDYSWGSIAVQLSLYAHASTLYDSESDEHSPMPEVDQETGIVAHLPAGQGTCALYAVDLVKGWEGALMADRVRAWRKEEFNLGRVDVASPPATTTRRDWLTERIRLLVTEHPDVAAVLAQRWPIAVPTLRQSDEHSIEQLDEIVVVLYQIEGEFRLPFGELDPTRNTKDNEERKTA
jgi:PD-(D/E)XK nuclease superfamily